MPDWSKEALVNRGWSQTVLPPGNWSGISGVWTESYDDVANLFRLRRGLDAAVTEFVICAPMEGRSRLGSDAATSKGLRLVSVELNYEVRTADLQNVTVLPLRYTPPANGVVAASTAIVGAYDAAHDLAAERGLDTANPELHTLLFTLTTADYFDADEALLVRVAVDGDAGAAGIFDWRSLVLHWDAGA